MTKQKKKTVENVKANELFWQSILALPIVYFIEVVVSGLYQFGMFTYATIFITFFSYMVSKGNSK